MLYVLKMGKIFHVAVSLTDYLKKDSSQETVISLMGMLVRISLISALVIT